MPDRYFTQVAQIFKDPKNTPALGTGHVALMLIDNSGQGVIFSFGFHLDAFDKGRLTGRFMKLRAIMDHPSFVDKIEINTDIVNKILSQDSLSPTGKANIDGYFASNSNKPIVYDMAYKEHGQRIYNTLLQLHKNPPRFRGIGSNCVNFVRGVLEKHNINTPYRLLPTDYHHALNEDYIDRISSINKRFDITKLENSSISKWKIKSNTIYYNRLPV